MRLDSKIETLGRINDTHASALSRLKIKTIRDLLYFFPTRYSSISDIKNIKDVSVGDNVSLFGVISNLQTKKSFKTKIPMGQAQLSDTTGKIKILWFHQAYLAKMINEGAKVKVTGKIAESKTGLYLTNPEFENTNMPIDTHDSLFNSDDNDKESLFGYPVYRETKGLTSKWIYHAIQKIFKSGLLDDIEEYIPEEILKKYNLPKIKSALIWIHNPKSENDANAARKRFAFEEVFFIQLQKQQIRNVAQNEKAYKIKVDDADVKQFIERFPFTATTAQNNAINQILNDFQKENPMSRLLEGDVGSGKTAVAATASYSIIKNRPFDKNKNEMQTFGSLQVAYMAPTEILATQLFENFTRYFAHTGINIGLITGSGCRKFPSKIDSSKLTGGWTNISRTQLLKWVENGEIPILIGTHALIQKSVKFKHLALVIIDEQHRFGTMQRSKLAHKESSGKLTYPHLLSMTATPIPRTLALTIYGDLDLTLIDEMPKGRLPIKTQIIPPPKREEIYEEVREELKNGRQLYVICARINEPDAEQEQKLNLKSVMQEADRLSEKIFPEFIVATLHSKMSKDEKDYIMQNFSDHKIDILVATSVVEVGVNVPNATIIIIEGAERFGLAQLHQLRGRVIRSSHQAYCYLFAESKTQKTIDRLKALVNAKNGFELAELDLALRGSGELAGTKQWGLSDLGMEAIKNIKMVSAARTEAEELIKQDPTLSSPHLSKLKSTLSERKLDEMHLE